jgi:hypothetical protein
MAQRARSGYIGNAASPKKEGATMKKRLSLPLLFTLALALAVPQARAEMIQTPDPERERVRAMLERPELAQELQKMGIAPDEARARVEAMTPAEVAQVAGKLDALPAGGAMSNRDLLLVILLIILLVIIL